ncbi:hypothetical protein N9047_01495, partial [bacterium]|nr:hypothetical protein [bacterium]
YKYFSQDKETYKFSEDSLSRLQNLCQFDQRKNLRGFPNKLIIPDPKTFNRLGKLIKHKMRHENETIRNRADDLIQLVEAGEVDSEGNLEMTIDRACSLLTKEINRKEWVSSVKALLETQQNELPFDRYDAEGNHLRAKEGLEKSIVHLRKLFDV